MNTLILPSLVYRDMNNYKTQQIKEINNNEEFTYCNVCTRFVEIVSYNDELDLALCAKCVDRPQAVRHYLKSKLDALIESVCS